MFLKNIVTFTQRFWYPENCSLYRDFTADTDGWSVAVDAFTMSFLVVMAADVPLSKLLLYHEKCVKVRLGAAQRNILPLTSPAFYYRTAKQTEYVMLSNESIHIWRCALCWTISSTITESRIVSAIFLTHNGWYSTDGGNK